MDKLRSTRYGLLILVLFLAGACASTKPPTQELARTEATLNQAEQVGAEDYAPLIIREAHKKLRRAQELSEEGKHEKARLLAERAEVDAELAEAKALSEKAQKAVQELRKSIKMLKQEIQKNSKSQ